MSFIVIILIFVVGAVLLRSVNQMARKTPPSSLPVAAKKFFFSRAEREFYETLKQALPTDYVAFPNVRLQDIFYITAKGDERRGVYSRFQDKHVDFLICERKNYRPVMGIELDGSSHDRAEQKYRDAVKEVLFRSAGVPLLRFRNEDKLSPPALATALGAYL